MRTILGILFTYKYRQYNKACNDITHKHFFTKIISNISRQAKLSKNFRGETKTTSCRDVTTLSILHTSIIIVQ